MEGVQTSVRMAAGLSLCVALCVNVSTFKLLLFFLNALNETDRLHCWIKKTTKALLTFCSAGCASFVSLLSGQILSSTQHYFQLLTIWKSP